MSTVFQAWYAGMPWKMQSIFANGLRAPDVASRQTKKVVRWLRTQTCNNADPNKPNCYMTAPEMNESLINDCVDELEYMTCHYVHHLADAARVVALFHPDEGTRLAAGHLHYLIAEEIFHFVPETAEKFIERHRDKVEHA